MTTEDALERNEVDHAFSNPVARTYLYSRTTYAAFLLLLLGLAVMLVGPLTGILLKRAVEDDVFRRQRIDVATPCFAAQEQEQSCSPDMTIDMSFFHVENVDGVVAGGQPVLREEGPYGFTATEMHSSVTYVGEDAVSFVKKGLTLQRACDTCDWGAEFSVMFNNGIQTATAETLAALLLQREDVVIELNTGARLIEEVNDVLSVGGAEVPNQGKYDGALFGDAFSSDGDAVVFDSWLKATVRLSKTTGDAKVRGTDSTQRVLTVEDDCLFSSTSCDDVTWNTASDVLHSLPFLMLDNVSLVSEPANFDSEQHGWSFWIDVHFGVTLSRATTYQANHWIDGYSVLGYRAPSHWVRFSSSATESDVAFIKDSLERNRRAFYICDLAMPLCGAVLVLAAMGLMFCTSDARKRLKTIQVLARSRARDPRLLPSQFKSLGKFLQSQMRRKRTTQSVDSVTSGKSKAPMTSKDFDDVRIMTPTENASM